MVHQHDHPAGSVDQVHGPAHALDHGSGHHPVGQVTVAGHLHTAEHGDVDVTAADHRETGCRVEVRRTGHHRHRLLAGIDQVGVDLVVVRERPDSEDAVLGV